MPNNDGNELLIRLDERLKSIQAQFDTFGAKVFIEIDRMKTELKDDRTNVEDKYVTREEFDPVKKAVFSAIGVILAGVLAAIGSLVIRGVK